MESRLKYCEDLKAAVQSVSPDPGHDDHSTQRGESSAQGCPHHYFSTHKRGCSENPAAYLLTPNTERPRQGCTRQPAVLTTQPQPMQAPTHYLLSRMPSGNAQPPTGGKETIDLERAKKASYSERFRALQLLHSQAYRRASTQCPKQAQTQRTEALASLHKKACARGTASSSRDVNLSYTQLPDRMAAMELDNEPREFCAQPDTEIQIPAYEPVSWNPDYIPPREFYGNSQSKIPTAKPVSIAAPKTACFSEQVAATQPPGNTNKCRRSRQALEELALLERAKRTRLYESYTPWGGYQPPFPTPNYSPASSSEDLSESLPQTVQEQSPKPSSGPNTVGNMVGTQEANTNSPQQPLPVQPEHAVTAPILIKNKDAITGEVEVSGSQESAPAEETFTPSPTAKQLETGGAGGWKVADLLSRRPTTTTPRNTAADKSQEKSLNLTPSQTQEKRVEWWQRWGPSQSKETETPQEVPSIPPPYPANTIIVRKGEVWIEDIGKESSSDDSEERPPVEDWEIVEESELYEQDERDWQAVKEIDKDIARRGQEDN
ncbi:hypothetical protein TWF281_001381 [Arthrobotrys megalospora]